MDIPRPPKSWDPFHCRSGPLRYRHCAASWIRLAAATGFDATKQSYVDWLIKTIEEFEEPVHLVGHDWGGALTIRVATSRSEPLRSWASDALYLFDPSYEWHRFAKTRQTPDVGERDAQLTLATPPAVRAPAFERLGVPRPWAERVAGWFDQTMADCTLDLYRSAVNITAEWGPEIERITAPGVGILTPEDVFASEQKTRQSLPEPRPQRSR